MSTTHEKVKRFAHDHMLIPWQQKRLDIGPSVSGVIATLKRFEPFLISAYDTFFVENERGLAFVTCISEQGLRVEYFGGTRRRRPSYEWLHFTDGAIRGDNNVKRRLAKQP
jgi:hypothetical protein